MEGIKNYTIKFFSADYPHTKNITAEEALMLMRAIDMDKKQVIVNGELYATHQIVSITRNHEAEKDECYGKKLTSEQIKSLDIRNLKHDTQLAPGIKQELKRLAKEKSMPPIMGSAENPEL